MATTNTMKISLAILCCCIFPAVLSIRLEDQKNYYSPPDPNAGTPPPSSGHHHHGGGSTPSTPSHGGGGGGSHHHGGYNPTPSTPECGTPPQHSTPPTYTNPPPSPDSGSPSPPLVLSPPITTDPGTTPPTIPDLPSPPYLPSPSSPTGTCTYWSTHPGLIWGVLGWWGTLGHAFGVTSLPGFGSDASLLQALSNTRTDGYGALYREATASWLNSLVNNRFPFDTNQVRHSFVSALRSNSAAAAQAHTFKLANEGHFNPTP